MGIFRKLLNLGPKRIPILKAVIVFDEDNNASVSFEKLRPECNSPEYIKLVLHYYAKTLVNIDPDQADSVYAYDQLLTSIERISNARLEQNSHILKIADIDDVVKLSEPKNQRREFVATLFALSAVMRQIKTKIPLRGFLQQMTFSVPVLIKGALKYLDHEEIKTLQLALKWMNEQYASGVDFRDTRTWASVPIDAFLFVTSGTTIEDLLS